ncbi:UNVERIFIED_CONTAM: putative mitochondrial protein [Sesamum radiatum]|uniref:Mitochondrial protein n=1 Tax=Sesamum radiatum TaxID=300843 RepID=A0AAW2TZ08_SESRA
MIVLSWNCRGLGTSSTVRKLGEVLREHHPAVVFLSETKCGHHRFESVKQQLGLFGVCVPAIGRSGGLALLWQQEVNIQLRLFSRFHIDVEVLSYDNIAGWRCTGFYGAAEASHRKVGWDILKRLSRQSDAPWMCIGDFNEILFQYEKTGASRPAWQILDFRQTLSFCDFSDLGYWGQKFTWCNNRQHPETVRARLDRAVANPAWVDRFPRHSVTHTASCQSDHKMVILDMKQQSGTQRRRRTPQFCFDARWLQSEDCKRVIEVAWGKVVDGDSHLILWKKIQQCRIELLRWKCVEFDRPQQDIRQLEERYGQLENRPLTTDIHQEIRDIRAKMAEYETREMLRWQQRSKEHWLANGDGNTKYFHSRASSRKMYNNISRLKDGDGRWQDTEEGIQEILLQHYRSIFASIRPSTASIDEVVSGIPRRVTPEMNALLSQPFTAAEAKQALFGMFPFKSPGPDGMSPIFFQQFWNIVGTDVSNSVLRILNERSFLYKMNYTHVVLIPKCDNLEVVSQLRPISLCNVVVKIASKCLANRLKGLMNSIISPSQSAFIPDRLITDNVLLAFELNHFLKVSSRLKKGFAALKLDMSKAYDRVEWSFLRRVLLRLGFESEFVELIMLLVTTVSYSLTLNGEPFGYFRPEKGIRQEAFSCLIQRAEEQGVVQGIPVSPEAPSISHLLFVDDTLLFCEATDRQLDGIRSILRLYSEASGQEVNLSKSSIVISGAVRDEEKRRLASRLGVRLVEAHDRYLGLPAIAGRSRRALFHNIRDRFWGRINGWNSKLLSQAGKGVLIKSVLQSLPTYAMSCFNLPANLLQDMEKMMRDFWWHSRGDRRVHWVAWGKMCRPIVKGGMGFRDLNAFNIALLAKQGWRVLSQQASLLSQVLKARYFPQCLFWEATMGSRPSLTWRSILLARGVLRVGCEELSAPINPREERVIWKPSKKGLFSVRSAYEVVLHLDARVSASPSRPFPLLTEGCENFWQQMWALMVPPRVRVQVWRFCYEAIPTMDNLAKRNRGVDTSCIRCEAGESIKHVLWECPFARMVWALSNISWRLLNVWTEGTAAWIFAVLHKLDRKEGGRFVIICWALWLNRNKKRMEGIDQSPLQVVREASDLLVQYQDVRTKIKLGVRF